MHACMHACIYIYMYVYIYMYIYMYIGPSLQHGAAFNSDHSPQPQPSILLGPSQSCHRPRGLAEDEDSEGGHMGYPAVDDTSSA